MSDETYPQVEPIDPGFPDLDDWMAFWVATAHGDRFALSDSSRKFIRKVQLACFDHWAFDLQEGYEFFRARIHPLLSSGSASTLAELLVGFESPLSDDEIGAPPIGTATGGRANPTGVPYLYLSDDPATALAEVRPWLGARVTVARFATARKLKIADLRPSSDETAAAPENANKDGQPSDKEKPRSLRSAIGECFARPLDPRHETGYAPTQIIAEGIKLSGFEGIAYPSAMKANGWNLALFQTKSARPISKAMVTINKINYSHQ